MAELHYLINKGTRADVEFVNWDLVSCFWISIVNVFCRASPVRSRPSTTSAEYCFIGEVKFSLWNGNILNLYSLPPFDCWECNPSQYSEFIMKSIVPVQSCSVKFYILEFVRKQELGTDISCKKRKCKYTVWYCTDSGADIWIYRSEC